MLPGNREFVLVSEGLWDHYQKRWREIEQEWLGGGTAGWEPEVLAAAIEGIRAGRAALRAQVRKIAKDYAGTYLVPV
jgi:hypothetical protein